jgi:hypothetical protein
MTQSSKQGPALSFWEAITVKQRWPQLNVMLQTLGYRNKPATCGVYLDRRASNVEEVVRLCRAGEERSATTPFDQGRGT